MFDLKITKMFSRKCSGTSFLACEMSEATREVFDQHPSTISLFSVTFVKSHWSRPDCRVIYIMEV